MAGPASLPRVMRFGVFEVDLRAGELRKSGVRVKLQEQPFQVLSLLLQQPGEVVTREELRQKLWPADTFVDFDHSLNTAITKLREALRDTAESPRYVETLPRRGYRFIAPAERPARKIWRIAMPAGAVVFVLLLLFGLNVGSLRNRLFGRAGPAKIQSLAVLPLENLSRDPEQQYFVDGITEALTAELSKISALRVISRTSAMQFKSVRKPLPEIARALGVDAVVEGSVLRVGNRVRVTAELIGVTPERHLWANTYDRDLRDILVVHSELAQSIAREIRVTLTPQEQSRLASTRAVNPEAYEAYLRGRYHWNRWTGDEIKRAIEYFRFAIEKDPGYALAYVGLAYSYNTLPAFAPALPNETFPEARRMAAKALQLDETLPEAHAVLAWTMAVYDWDWSGADREFKRALELNPGSAESHRTYGWFLAWLGRFDEALAHARRARELEPLSVPASRNLGAILFCARQYDQALSEWRKALEMDPDYFLVNIDIARVYVEKGMYKEAIAQYQKAMDLVGGGPRNGMTDGEGLLGNAYALAGRKSDALRLIDTLKRRLKHMYVSPLNIAVIYTGLGQREQAFEWLERAYRERAANMNLLKVAPPWDPLRSDPRFQDLLRRMNFPP